MTKRRRPSLPAERPVLQSRARRTPRLLAILQAAQTDAPLPHPTALAFILLFTLPLLLVFLGTGDAVDMMELFNLVPIREAIRDHHWLMPTLDGVARLEKPPLPVWIPAALATLVHSDSLWVLRFASVVMGILTAFATYGLGCTFFKNPNDPPATERKYALLAAVLLPTMLVFNREAHLASYDIYATAFLTIGAFFLARAAEVSFRASMGYAVLAGVATGLSILSKGPVPVATVMVPLGIWLLIFHRRRGPWVAVGVAAVVSVGVFVPWLVVIGGIPGVVAATEPRAWHVWYTELFQFGTGNADNPAAAGTRDKLQKSLFYYAQIFIWVAPVVPTFIAGLVMPFLPTRSEPAPSAVERRGRWLFWLVVVVGLVMLSVPSEKKPRYALQLFPFAALLCAAVWQEFRRLPASKPMDAGGKIFLAAQALFFIVPAVGGLVGIAWAATTPELPRWMGSIVPEALRSLPRPLSLTLLLATAAAGIYFWRVLFRRQFGAALVALAGCSWLLVFAGQAMYRAAPSNHTNTARHATEQAMSTLGPYPVYSLPGYRPWLSTLYYADRPLPQADLPTLISRANDASQNPMSLIFLKNDAEKAGYALAEELKAFEAATHRQVDFITTWYDDGRHTAFYHYTPAIPETAPATQPAAR